MKKNYLSYIAMILLTIGFRSLSAQVSLTATSGTLSGSYPTLKGAFDAINAGTHMGAINILISANTAEGATAVLNASGVVPASYSRISIQPTGGTPVSVSGAIAGPLVDFNGADNVYIDGLNAGGNTLTFENTNTGSATTCTFRYIGDAVGDTITNCNIMGASTSATLGTIIFATGTVTGNDNNVISNCSIGGSGATFATNAIYCGGTATAGIENSNNSIINNNIFDYFHATLSTSGITLNTGAVNWNISNNRLYQTATRTYTAGVTHRAINVAIGYGHMIANNTIGYASADSTGMSIMTSTTSPNYVAINLGVSNIQTTTVLNNKINAIRFTTTNTNSTIVGVFACVNITGVSANVNIIGNTFGSTSGIDSIVLIGGSSALLVGINSSSTGIVSIQNNTFGAFTNANAAAATAANLTMIGATGSHAGLTITGNTIGNATANNMRAGITGTTTAATQVSGIFAGGINSGTTSFNNNIVQNLLSAGSGASGWARGIFTVSSTATSLYNCKSNVISNITCSGATTGIASGSVVNGIFIAIGANDTISNNTIFNLFVTNTGTANTIVSGIVLMNALNPVVYNNTIYNLQNAGIGTTASTPPTVAGITMRTGSGTIRIFNNMISLGSGQTTNTCFIGIWGNHGSTPDPGADSIMNNTVNITGAAASGALPSFCYNRGDLTTAVKTIPQGIVNNIFTNDRTGGTGKHYAISNNYGATATTVGWGAGASNNNILNAATTTVGYWSADQSFATWKSISTSDAVSYSGVPVTYTNSANDLHLNLGTTPSVIESGAANTSVTADFDGQVRPGPIGSVNGGGIKSDMGADEADLVPSLMVLDSSNTDQFTDNVPVGSKSQVVMRVRMYASNTFSTLVLQSLKLNTGGTVVADIDSARVYYTGSNNNFSTATQYGTLVAAPNGTFYITGAQPLILGANYFWVTYNVKSTATPNNIIDVLLDSIKLSGVNYAPINGDPGGSRTIKARLAGDYTVGSGGDFTTLTAAVSDLNLLGVSAPVRFILTSPNYTVATGETFPITFNAYANSSAVNKVTILPQGFVTASINGSSTTPILDFNGAANITVSGTQNGNGSPKNLTIENTNIGGVAVRFINDAKNIKFSNDSIKGVNTSSTGGVVFFSTGIVNGNDSIVIDSCNIGDGLTGTPATSIYSIGSVSNTTIANSNITISNCNIYNFWNGTTESNAFKVSGGNTDWVMTGNSMYQTTARGASAALQQYIWNINNTSGNNNIITNNFVGGTAPLCGGVTPYTVSGTVSVRFTGTYLNVGSIVPTTVSGNTFTNMNWTGGTTANTTAPGVWGAVFVQGGVVNTINNTIGSMTANSAISITSSINNNQVFPIAYGSASPGTQNIKKNNIGGIKVEGNAVSVSTSLVAISNSGVTTVMNIDSNTVGSTLANSIELFTASTSGTAQSVIGISNTANTIVNYNGNTIQNLTNAYAGTGTGLTTGITTTTGINSIVKNTIQTLTTATPQAGTAASASILGISMQSVTGGSLVSGNIISNLTNTSTTGATRVTGIDCASNANGTDLVTRNLVYSLNCLSVSASTASVAGIRQNSGNLRVVNNMVRLGYDTLGVNTGSNVFYIGLNKGAGTMKAFYNTIYVGGTVTDAGTAQSNAVYLQAAAADSIVNNIFVNDRTNTNVSATGNHYPVNTTSTAGAVMNNNIYKSAGSLFAVVGSVNYATINTWRSLGMDVNSAVGDPMLVNPTGTGSTLNLRVAGTTPVEAAGMPVSGLGVSVDYDGQTRALLTPNDIGAAAGNFIANDIFVPLISYTPLSNYGATTDRSFYATISDASKVLTLASPPRVYFKKMAAGTYDNTVGTLISGTVTNGTWLFTIPSAALGGMAVNDSIYYYVIAQDSSLNSNVGSFPAGVIASSTNPIGTHPLPVYSFKVVPGLSGTLTVGTLGTYPSLTGTGGVFEAINGASLTGNVTVSILSNLTETGAVSLNQFGETGAGGYTVSIVPSDATEKVISGGLANGLITLNGADRVKIDGRFNGSGKYLRIRNRNVNGSTIKLMNDARRDSILYVYVEGTTTAVGAVYFNTPATGGSGNDSNVVMYCVIRDTLGNPANGVIPNTGFYSDGALNSENIFAYNEVLNYTYQGVNIVGANNDNWNISNNSFYQTASGANKAGTLSSGPTQAIYVNSATSIGYTINANNIGGSAADRSGAAYLPPFSTGGATMRAIDLTMGLSAVTTVSNNLISNVSTTVGANAASSSFIAIGVNSGNINITGNIIGGGATPSDTIRESTNGSTNLGTIVLVGGNVTVSNNTIGNITDIGSTTGSNNRAVGITVVGSLGGSNFNILNNTIRDIKASNQPTTGTVFTYNAMSPAGIVVFAPAAIPVNIEGNTIYNLTNTNTLGVNTAVGMNIRGGICTIHRNRIYNIGGVGTGAGVNSNVAYGIMTTTTGHTIRNNQISLTTAAASDDRLFGMMDASTAAGTNNYYNNSVYIGGSANGTNNSYAMIVGTTATENVFNNIFYNARTGTGNHYAMGAQGTSGITAATNNYNLLVTPTLSAIVEMPASTSLDVSGVNALYTSGNNSQWMDIAANVSAASLFTNTTTGNLGIVTANAISWYAHGKGLPMASVATDFNNATRSTTIVGGSTDLGSVEFTTSTLPLSATASAAPATSTTTTYSFANRQVASFVWGAAGTVPTALDVKYYSGVSAPNLLGGKTQYKSYVTATPTGGTGYAYNISIRYDSAMFGNVSSVASSRLAYYSGTTWNSPAASSANNGMLAANISLTAAALPGNFTGTDMSNSLPVSLVQFTATPVSGNVQLGWITASEMNNVGFEVERSVNGKSFVKVGFVKGAGNSSKQLTYALTDNKAFTTAASNNLYYRLKQVDMDGTIRYSEVINVSQEQTETMSVNVYPNPVINEFTVSAIAKAAGQMQVTIMDIQGKVVTNLTKETVEGKNTMTIDGAVLNGTGIYFVKVMVDGESKVMKLVKH